MQLTGQEASARGFVKNGQASSVRPASYDLRVGTIVRQGSKQERDTTLEPQEIFLLVSKEIVEVPAGFVGYAMPKTSLCNDGILALNTGIIDPGYSGPLSTTAINFGKNPYRIKPGDPFLRVVFHPLQGKGSDASENLAKSDVEYLADRVHDSSRYPTTFLDVPGQVERLTARVTKDVLEKERNYVFWLLAILTLVFGLWNWASYALMSRQSSTAIERVLQLQTNNSEVADLRARLNLLEGRVNQQVTGQPRKP